jgi:putative acetyltransferase
MNDARQACELRPSCEADYDAIAEIWHRSASLPGVGPAVMPTEAELRGRLDAEFAAGWQVTLACRGDDIVGFLAIRPAEAVLAELFVRPGSLGAGIGRALLRHATAVMPDGFTLHTRATNERACRFYEKAGLTVLRHGVHPRSGDPLTYYGWNTG